MNPDKPCPFCNPDPDQVFFETELVLGLWDRYPASPGHALLVPRQHIADWFEADPATQLALIAALPLAREEIAKHHDADGYNIGINSGEAAGQTVFHLHVHLMPRYKGDQADPRGGVRNVMPDKAKYWETRVNHGPTGLRASIFDAGSTPTKRTHPYSPIIVLEVRHIETKKIQQRVQAGSGPFDRRAGCQLLPDRP